MRWLELLKKLHGGEWENKQTLEKRVSEKMKKKRREYQQKYEKIYKKYEKTRKGQKIKKNS